MRAPVLYLLAKLWYIEIMNKILVITLFVVGGMLIFNGLINISDDATVRAYDIASILSGVGFGVVAWLFRGRV